MNFPYRRDLYKTALLFSYAVLYFLLLCKYPYTFSYNIYVINQYDLSLIGLIFFIPFTVHLIKAKDLSWFRVVYFLVCLILLLLFIATRNISYANQHYTTYLALLFVFLPLLSNPRYLIPGMWYILFLFFIVQLFLIVKQQSEGKALWGTYKNLNVISCYLVINIPLLHYLLFEKTGNGWPKQISFKYVKYILFTGVYAYILFVCIHNKSRTAIIGFCFISLLMLFEKLLLVLPHFIKRKKLFFFACTILIIVLTGISYKAFTYFRELKYGSYKGRLLAWEICLQNADTYFLTGVGFGRTPSFYPDWQVNYFKDYTGYADDKYLLASESYLLYNDILQLFVEWGVIGFTIFCILLYLLFKKKCRDKGLGNMVKATMAIIVICAFSNCLFLITTVVFIFFLCIITLISNAEKPAIEFAVPASITRLSACVCLVIVLPLSFKLASKVFALWEIKEPVGIKKHGSVYSLLKDDGKYLAQSGILLEEQKRWKEAIPYFEESKKFYPFYNTIFSLGNCYKKTGNYNKAIEQFLYLSRFVPHKFVPRYELLKLYILTNRKEEAITTARLILNMEEKVPSWKVREIKYYTREILNSLLRKEDKALTENKVQEAFLRE